MVHGAELNVQRRVLGLVFAVRGVDDGVWDLAAYAVEWVLLVALHDAVIGGAELLEAVVDVVIEALLA